MNSVAIRSFFLLTLFAVLGCGQQGPVIVPVTGSVTLDGKPIADAAVVFTPVNGGRPAVGTTNSKGEFQLTTLNENDGALEGSHTVTVTKVEMTGIEAGEDGLSGHITSKARQVWIVPKEYSRQDTSGISAEVAREMTPLVFALTTRK